VDIAVTQSGSTDVDAPFLALTADKHIVSWGKVDPGIDWGQFAVPDAVQGHAVDIASGMRDAGAITDTGQVVLWGDLKAHESIYPAPPELAGETAVDLRLNGWAMVLTSTGHVYSWGSDVGSSTSNTQMNTVPGAIQGRVTAIASYYGQEVALTRALAVATVPVAAGAAKVGQTLTLATDATFSGGGTPGLTVQWLADGDPITDATGDSLTLTADLVGKSITVAQTATLGDQTATATSNPVGPVAPSQATTTLRATANATTYGIPARVTVTANTTSATGPVQIKNGTRILGTANLTAGRATVTLPGTALTAGLHTLTAAYAGNVDNTAASTTVRLSVTKATAKLRVTVKPRKLTKAKLKRAKATITITAVGYTPTGKVTIRLKKKRITVSLVNGKAVINLKKIAKFAKKGKNKITIAYTGDTNTNPTTTRTTLKLSK
jgi:hypothetical protein